MRCAIIILGILLMIVLAECPRSDRPAKPYKTHRPNGAYEKAKAKHKIILNATPRNTFCRLKFYSRLSRWRPIP